MTGASEGMAEPYYGTNGGGQLAFSSFRKPNAEVAHLPGRAVKQQLEALVPTFGRGHLDKSNARLLQE